MYGKYPYMGLSDFDILKKIKSTRPDFTGVNISDNSKDFINKCLTIDPQKRITWR
jgi:serine/threonine protein kinase